MKEIIIEDTIYRIGKNAKDNTELIQKSNQEWYWFHLSKFPSCHIVVCKDEINQNEIINACNLVKENSKYKFNNIGIHYCKISNLITCEKPGSVIFKSNKKVKTINI